MITDQIIKLYEDLHMECSAFESDNVIPHLVRIIEELVRRDKIHQEINEMAATAAGNLQEQIKVLQKLGKT